MFKKLALVATLVAAPIAATAQYNSAPAYTFGGSGPSGFPGLFGGYPGAYPNTFQNQFLTMPFPQYGYTQTPQTNNPAPAPQFYTSPPPQWGYTAPAVAPTIQQAQPYGQTNQPQTQNRARYINEIPPSSMNQSAPQASYGVPGNPYAQPNYANGVTAPRPSPPRWVPLNGLPTFQNFAPRPNNNWSMAPFFQNNPSYAPPATDTPPRWPTQ